MLVEQYIFRSKRRDRINAYRKSDEDTITKSSKEKEGSCAWSIYDEKLLGSDSIGTSFGEVIPKGYNMKDFVEARFSDRAGKALGLELGGPGSMLFSQFREGFFRKTAGVTLNDTRNIIKRSRDLARNHRVIAADLRGGDSHNLVDAWRDGQQIDFLIERMAGGLSILPKDPYFFSRKFLQWYEVVRQGGVLFLQVPDVLKPLIHRWADLVNQQNNHQDSDIANKPINTSIFGHVIRIDKHENGLNLPLLTAREVSQCYREFSKHIIQGYTAIDFRYSP